ncbi:efflux RND transporter periplasmic adaptor subunit [Litorilinea aerophila]|uniref:HlyD family efflux transporter periplasmic adaptor subunit n=1 Tax=Litorilinea aerophila TaxID=1204385 RepID=A0A540VA99_9CHLR|nr:efflux RND transporter periplasmic adaptor subunit [Litorilinea aerophila]MCC9078415.1 efflux RND transporter periplasmic adaptor subunit [Litorilinea aerophila]
MKRMLSWTVLFVLFASIGFGTTLMLANGAGLQEMLTQALTAQPGTLSASSAGEAAPQEQLPPPGPVPVNAVGRIDLVTTRQVVLESSGRISEIAVEVGDQVEAGDLLMSLDTTQLEWALEKAEINFETARLAFEKLGRQVDESDIALAEANLLSAQENLARVKAGYTPEELAAAESAAAAAWARYNELKERPTQAQIVQAQANLKKAELAVQAAQREYDKIAWLPESAATAAADNLQRATIDYEAAKAAYEEAIKPATQAELQSALSAAQQAQHNLNQLKEKPTPAELAEAEARVAAAEHALKQAQEGVDEADQRTAELRVRQAMIDLEQARLNLQNAQVLAPVAGTVLDISVELGQQGSAGTVVATLADLNDIELVANVEQRDIARVHVGQVVEISVYALPDEHFQGVVEKIAPVADSGASFVTFPVIIRLTDGPLELIRPGMTASANFMEGETATPEAQAEPTEDTSGQAESAEQAEGEGESTEADATATPAPSGGNN